MRRNRTLALYFVAASALLLALLPAANLFGGRQAQKATLLARLIDLESQDRLYNMDLVESQRNWLLYKLGISGNFGEVVVGKQGWLFLGDAYNFIMSKARGIYPVANGYAEQWARNMKSRQDWLASLGIPMVFAIAPNKVSVYPEMTPDWVSIPQRNSTDSVVEAAQRHGVHIIDLRPALRAEKVSVSWLYNRVETHWTAPGAYTAYRELMRKAGEWLPDLRFVAPSEIDFAADSMPPCCLAWMLKISPRLPADYGHAYRAHFPGAEDPLCVARLNRTLEPLGECENQPNEEISVNQYSWLVRNPQALNKARALILRDSFGTLPSKLFNATFSESWQIHHGHLRGPKAFPDLVLDRRPDIVLYLVAERALLNPHLANFLLQKVRGHATHAAEPNG